MPIPVLQCIALYGCTELCDAVPEADYLDLHGLNVCSRKVVISNASLLHDGAYRADWKAVVSAEGSCGLQHNAEVLGLEEEPSKVAWLQWQVCCETAAELMILSCHPPGLGSSFLLPHLSSANCFPVSVLCVVCSRFPGQLSGWQQDHEKLQSLEVPFVGQLIFNIHVKPLWNCTHRAEACLVTVNMQGMKSGPGETTSNIHWWSMARISLSVASCATVEKNATFSLFFWSTRLLNDNLEFSVLIVSPTSLMCFSPALCSAYPSFYITLCLLYKGWI